MKKIMMVTVILLLALNIIGCVPTPTAPLAPPPEEISDLEAAQRQIKTLEGKMERASKYAEFMAWFMGAPEEPKAMMKYYAEAPGKALALGDPEVILLLRKMAETQMEMLSKGATSSEIMKAVMPYTKRLLAHISNKIVEALK